MKNTIALLILIFSTNMLFATQQNVTSEEKTIGSKLITYPLELGNSIIQKIQEVFNAETSEEDRPYVMALIASSITFIVVMSAYLYYSHPKGRVPALNNNIVPQPRLVEDTINSANPRNQNVLDYLPSPDPLRPNLSFPKFICHALADDLETINGATRVKQS